MYELVRYLRIRGNVSLLGEVEEDLVGDDFAFATERRRRLQRKEQEHGRPLRSYIFKVNSKSIQSHIQVDISTSVETG